MAAARERLAAGAAASAPDQLLRRLTHSQYNNTVRDLLGDYSRPADRFPPEDFVNGFKNQLRTQGMPPLLAEAYSAVGREAGAERVPGGRRQRAGAVQARVGARREVPRSVRARFGLRAFRRPLTDAEFRRYAALFSAQAAKTGQFLDGARVVVEAMLQSPKFLFHVESGADGSSATTRSPAGSRTSCGTRCRISACSTRRPTASCGPPKASSAWRGACSTQPPARQAVDEFFAQWLRFDRVLGSVKDRRRYPEFTPELAAMMVQETRMLLGNLVWNDGNFMEAFTADYSFLNSDLASLYGVPAPSGEFELRAVPGRLAPRRAARAGIVPGVDRRTGRDLADRARHLHPRAAAVPARAESAARREHRSAGADGRHVR